MNTSSTNPYKKSQDGIFRPTWQIIHREEEYDPAGFATLHKMQEKHFWYRGRHRFLMHALDRYLPSRSDHPAVIDLGGGVGRAPSMAMLTFSKSMNVRDFLLDVVCTRMMVCLLSA